MDAEGLTILTINGSRRRDGNTARVLDLIEESITRRPGAESGGGESRALRVHRIELSQLNVQPCRGCRLCFDRGEQACPLHDDVLSIRDRILAADGVVFASPVYVNDVSGTMKTLIDRLAFVCHRPAFYSTPAVLVATTGGSPARHTIRTLQGAHMSWGGRVVGTGDFTTGALTAREEIAAQYERTVDGLASTIHKAASTAGSANPGFLSLMMFAVQQASWRREFADIAGETIDECYWRENGWLDDRATYFRAHNAPGLLVFTARLVGKTIARFVV